MLHRGPAAAQAGHLPGHLSHCRNATRAPSAPPTSPIAMLEAGSRRNRHSCNRLAQRSAAPRRLRGGSRRVPRPPRPIPRPARSPSFGRCSTRSPKPCLSSTARAACGLPIPRSTACSPAGPSPTTGTSCRASNRSRRVRRPKERCWSGRPGRRTAGSSSDRCRSGAPRRATAASSCCATSRLAQEHRADRNAYLSILSHELRTPITTIYAGSRILSRRPVAARAPPEQLAADISFEAARLYDLVEDLLALTRLERRDAGAG